MLAMTGADGIGLFRTALQFLVSANLPQRERKVRLDRDVLDEMRGEISGFRSAFARTKALALERATAPLLIFSDQKFSPQHQRLQLQVDQEGSRLQRVEEHDQQLEARAAVARDARDRAEAIPGRAARQEYDWPAWRHPKLGRGHREVDQHHRDDEALAGQLRLKPLRGEGEEQQLTWEDALSYLTKQR